MSKSVSDRKTVGEVARHKNKKKTFNSQHTWCDERPQLKQNASPHTQSIVRCTRFSYCATRVHDGAGHQRNARL
jgi:hypothetical protein